ncbi:MAG: response regulator transcription factor [Pseudomonadota bacterium]|nr:response regulator transcription factor [Gammaproteobacteria bacterium]MBU1558396.1 response regulator transcription factor [Gammaproteobacteria bacterium]MBU1629180.1 response regulator transcription factor [Gammaproteobacteria bacterium]MBU1927157.1 response regulator transcription factor [Gammaproteobacteria bacterium]MBU2546231.1 response regulator transcription factor [Gammaproteobacteria bacterium]
MRLLLVEDDEILGSGLREGLKLLGYTVDWIKDGLTAERTLSQQIFDVVILDIGLPKISGYELLARIRKKGIEVPVLIISANDLVSERIKGLDLGADDYLAKPIDLDELSARLRALQRRGKGRAIPVITYGDLILDPASHLITYKDEVITLPRREFALLLKLLENTGHVLSRDYLSKVLYGWDEEVDSNALEVHIHNLRKKFGTDFIRTIRGIGYIIDKENQLGTKIKSSS